MLKRIVLVLCLIGLTACTHKEIVKEFVYVPCTIPEIPESPKYFRVQFEQNAQNKIEFKSDNDVKGLLLNDLMNKTYMEELRTILFNLKVKK